MKYGELFTVIKRTDYYTSGDDVDWQILVNNKEKTIYLLFEESHGKTDWRNNFKFLALPYKPYKEQKNKFLVHSGFGKAWKSVNDGIINKLIKEISYNKEYKVIIAGWSYGGAIAQLAVEDFYYRTGEKATLITYGAPKIFFGKSTKKYFSDCVNKAIQISHVSDIVTKLVPGYHRINTVKVGKEGWKFWRLFNPENYHCNYDDETLYKKIEL